MVSPGIAGLLLPDQLLSTSNAGSSKVSLPVALTFLCSTIVPGCESPVALAVLGMLVSVGGFINSIEKVKSKESPGIRICSAVRWFGLPLRFKVTVLVPAADAWVRVKPGGTDNG